MNKGHGKYGLTYLQQDAMPKVTIQAGHGPQTKVLPLQGSLEICTGQKVLGGQCPAFPIKNAQLLSGQAVSRTTNAFSGASD